MKRTAVAVLFASLFSGCASQMEQAAQQDRETFLQCKQQHPSDWGDRCQTELQMYQTTASAAEAESQHRAAQAQAIAGGLLAGALVGAAAYSASRPVYVAPAPVYVVPCHWNCW
jgi:hypothetical protein